MPPAGCAKAPSGRTQGQEAESTARTAIDAQLMRGERGATKRRAATSRSAMHARASGPVRPHGRASGSLGSASNGGFRRRVVKMPPARSPDALRKALGPDGVPNHAISGFVAPWQGFPARVNACWPRATRSRVVRKGIRGRNPTARRARGTAQEPILHAADLDMKRSRAQAAQQRSGKSGHEDPPEARMRREQAEGRCQMSATVRKSNRAQLHPLQATMPAVAQMQEMLHATSRRRLVQADPPRRGGRRDGPRQRAAGRAHCGGAPLTNPLPPPCNPLDALGRPSPAARRRPCRLRLPLLPPPGRSRHRRCRRTPCPPRADGRREAMLLAGVLPACRVNGIQVGDQEGTRPSHNGTAAVVPPCQDARSNAASLRTQGFRPESGPARNRAGRRTSRRKDAGGGCTRRSARRDSTCRKHKPAPPAHN